MKAVILAAGKGTRMDPFTDNSPKPLISVAGKPFILHLIENVKKAGINESDIILVAGHRKEKIEEFVKLNSLKIKLVEQKEQLGTAHALLCAEESVKDEDFIVLVGDNLYSAEDIKEIVEDKDKICMLGVKNSTPEQFGRLVIENGFLKKIVEKDKSVAGTEAIVNTGLYKFTPRVFTSLKKLEKSERGEYELTDAVSELASAGSVSVHEAKGQWFDFTYPWHILNVNSSLINDMEEKRNGNISENAVLNGKVIVEEGAEILSNVHIEGPVYIGKNSKVGPNCYIRPGTMIGENVHIGNGCELKNSVIMKNTKIPHLSYVGDTVVGENCNFGAGTKVANLRFDDANVKVMINGELIDSGNRKIGAFVGDNVKTGINCSIMPGVKIKSNSLIEPSSIVKKDV